ncbi:MAG: hypothetical protein SVS15_11140 [Thermodesulfobacteriota bacterium]|nr:hypothetical protein [Thermodesulfobacteriota bacterium]
MPFIFLAGLIFLAAGACAQRQWHHPRKTLADFNRDACECEIQAENAGKQASRSKSRIVWSAYAKAYDQCLMAAGWSPVLPQSRGDARNRPVSAEIKDNQVRAFGLVLNLPKGFVLAGQEQKSLGPTAAASFYFLNPNNWSLRLDFQKALAARFKPAEYPVPSAFIGYDQGDFGAPERLVWTVFCGRVRHVWVMGMGAYLMVDETRRVSMTMTAPLESPKGPPPSGLALDRGQRDEVEAFADTWKIWLRENFEE